MSTLQLNRSSSSCIALLIAFALNSVLDGAAIAQDKTVFKDPQQKARLLGKHMLSLQWLQFTNNMYGTATVTDKDGVLSLKGEQRLKGKESGYLTVDGKITEVTATAFKLNGKIVCSVSSINSGKECVREGTFNFLARGGRKYWRLQEMQSPCSEVTDYVDLYFH